jgi:hypothetical protein
LFKNQTEFQRKEENKKRGTTESIAAGRNIMSLIFRGNEVLCQKEQQDRSGGHRFVCPTIIHQKSEFVKYQF